MDERVPGIGETEGMENFLQTHEALAGISKEQRMSRILVGLMERHFLMQHSGRRPLRRNGRGKLERAEANIVRFTRKRQSMPSQEHASDHDLVLELRFIPGTDQYIISLMQLPLNDQRQTYQSGAVEHDQVLATVDAFLERRAAEEL